MFQSEDADSSNICHCCEVQNGFFMSHSSSFTAHGCKECTEEVSSSIFLKKDSNGNGGGEKHPTLINVFCMTHEVIVCVECDADGCTRSAPSILCPNYKHCVIACQCCTAETGQNKGSVLMMSGGQLLGCC